MKQNVAIDILRFAISLLVIAIHCGLKGENIHLYNIFQCSVPCFFVISAYYIEQKRVTNSKYLDKYIKKTAKLYVLWSIIFLPLTIYGIINSPSPIWKEIFYMFHNYLVKGDNYCSWPLWYLLALLYSCIIYRAMLNHKWSIVKISVAVFSITALGYIIEYGSDIKFFHYILSAFGGTTRNGLFQGLSFYFIGVVLSKEKVITLIRNNRIICSIIVIAIAPLCSTLDVTRSLFLDHIFCGLLVGLLLSSDIATSFSSKNIREIAIWIYFTHMYIVFSLEHFFGNYSFGEKTGIAIFTSLIISTGLYNSTRIYPKIKTLITG